MCGDLVTTRRCGIKELASESELPAAQRWHRADVAAPRRSVQLPRETGVVASSATHVSLNVASVGRLIVDVEITVQPDKAEQSDLRSKTKHRDG